MFDKDEYYVDLYTMEDRVRAAAAGQASTGIWTMKDGTKVHISEMSDNHLRNCINMLKRNDTKDLFISWIVTMEKELKNRGVE